MPVLRSLLLPLLILAAAVLGDHLQGFEKLPPGTVVLATRILLVAAILLGWRFRRGRSVLAALVLLLLAEGLQAKWLGLDSPATVMASPIWSAIALLVPLDLALLAWSAEASPLGWRTAWRLAFLGLQGLLLSPPISSRWLAPGVLPELSGLAVPLPGLVFALAAAGLMLRAWRKPGPIEAGWLALLTAFGLAVTKPASAVAYLGVGGAILLVALIERAFTLAFHDGLTGLPGRRALDERLNELGGKYSIAMVDLDHFKKLNDRYGHEVGDQVLRRVAKDLRAVAGDTAYRYGGEEFTILFPGLPLAAAKAELEKLRQRIATTPFKLRGPGRAKRKSTSRGKNAAAAPNARVTVSIGISERSTSSRSPAKVLKAADKALYRAKRTGRNRLASGRA